MWYDGIGLFDQNVDNIGSKLYPKDLWEKEKEKEKNLISTSSDVCSSTSMLELETTNLSKSQ